MIGFVSPVVAGFGASVAGARVSRSPVRVASRVSMKISPSMPFMEQPTVLDDESIAGNVGFDPLNLGTVFNFNSDFAAAAVNALPFARCALRFHERRRPRLSTAEVRRTPRAWVYAPETRVVLPRAAMEANRRTCVAKWAVAMLGTLGWVFPDIFRLPFPYFKALDPVAAHDYFVSTGGMSQIL
eukprot:IDg16792t1